MIEWIVFALIGVITGVFSGLLGLGGGLIVVPSLMAVFVWQDMADTSLMHIAVGTSLMTITVTSISSSYVHHQYQHINWKVFKSLTPSLLIGGLLGAYIATMFTSHILKQCFAFYVLFVAIRMWMPVLPKGSKHLVGNPILSVFGLSAGSISAIVGIGGGSLVVPYLVIAKQTMQQAIGTSAACGFPISVAAVIGFMLFGQSLEVEPNRWVVGQIHWQAFLGIISTSTLFSVLGAKLTRTLPVKVLKQIFSLVLFVIAVYLMK